MTSHEGCWALAQRHHAGHRHLRLGVSVVGQRKFVDSATPHGVQRQPSRKRRVVNLAAAATEMARLSRLLDSDLQAMRDQAQELADAENEYRKAKAQAWLAAPNDPAGTKPADREWIASAREAWVNGQTADARRRRDLAEGMGRAAYQAVRARQTQISALQSLLNAERAELHIGRTGPEMAA